MILQVDTLSTRAFSALYADTASQVIEYFFQPQILAFFHVVSAFRCRRCFPSLPYSASTFHMAVFHARTFLSSSRHVFFTSAFFASPLICRLSSLFSFSPHAFIFTLFAGLFQHILFLLLSFRERFFFHGTDTVFDFRHAAAFFFRHFLHAGFIDSQFSHFSFIFAELHALFSALIIRLFSFFAAACLRQPFLSLAFIRYDNHACRHHFIFARPSPCPRSRDVDAAPR